MDPHAAFFVAHLLFFQLIHFVITHENHVITKHQKPAYIDNCAKKAVLVTVA